MTHYSVHPRDRIFEKGYGFLSFAKNMCKNIRKNISKNLRAPFINCISRISNTQVDAHDIDVVMHMYNLIEYSDNYSKTSESLWQFIEMNQL